MRGFEPVEKWKEPDLEKVLDAAGRREQNWIEYKESGVVNDDERFRKKLAKALSAFGNRNEGGYLVVGVKGGTADKPAEIDGGVPIRFKKHGTKEWLGQLIPGQTDKHSPDCKVGQIDRCDDSSKIKEDHAVFVVWIPPNADMPVRSVVDKEFYYRKDAHSERLETQQVLDIINRRATPMLELKEVCPNVRDPWPDDPLKVPLTLQFHIVNASSKMAIHVGAELVVPAWLMEDTRYQPAQWATVVATYDPYRVCSTRLRHEVFPHQSTSLPAVSFVINLNQVLLTPPGGSPLLTHFAACPEIALILYADDAPPRWWPVSFEEPPLLGAVTDVVLKKHGSSIAAIRHYRQHVLHGKREEIAPVVQKHLDSPLEGRKLRGAEQEN